MTKALDYFDPTRDYPSTVAKDTTESAVQIEDSIAASVESSKANAQSELEDVATTIEDIESDRQQELSALKAAFAHTQCQYLVVSFTTDWRFAPERSQEIVDALMATGKPVSYINIDAPHGHDSFLFDIPRYMGAVKGFLTAPFITPSRPAVGERS